MARVCVRPGCDRDAVARLTYDTITCQVWLDPLGDRPGRAQEICTLHTDRLTVPRGWMLCDRRSDEPAMFVTVAATALEEPTAVAATEVPRPEGRPGRRRAGRRRPRASGPGLFDRDLVVAEEAAAPQEATVVPIVVEPPAVVAPSEPSEPSTVEPAASAAEETAEPDATPAPLRATSPLLARAFAATGPQRSVITQRIEADED